MAPPPPPPLNEKVTLPYLRRIFESHAGPEKTWTRSQASSFVRHVQDADDGSPAATALLGPSSITIDDFLRYMTSKEAGIALPLTPCDLTWPLCSYFINSSHNTYLTGNQLSSDSTTEAYTRVLRRGCRCVEIDVWDGVGYEDVADTSSSSSSDEKHKSRLDSLRNRLPDSLAARLEKTSVGKTAHEEDVDTEPRVLHGYTLTRHVPFRDVCHAIRESAFAVTDLPLIVSLEVHCSPRQQAVMVDIIKDAWRGLLVTTPTTAPSSLPSPDSLRRKILVKVKHVHHQDEHAAPPVSKITHALSRLGIYTKAVSFKTWTQPEASMPTHIFSLSESKFLDHDDKNPTELFDHNRDYLMRVYPSGLRIASSNLYPPVFWAAGAQIVALNWQQTDEGMMLNEGMFAGSDGYVLKPEGFRPRLASPASPRRQTLFLTLTFLAAQAIPLPLYDTSARRFHPYVKTEIHVEGSDGGLAPPSVDDDVADDDDDYDDCKEGEADEEEEEEEEEENEEKDDTIPLLKARTRTHRGRDVDLGAEKFQFAAIPGLVPELTFVRFTIRDDEIGRDDLAAWACVRLDRLGQGYRFVPLRDARGSVVKGAALLIKVEKRLVANDGQCRLRRHSRRRRRFQ
ncbi:hypothetical protein L249_6419 [Ophiocordyceps polyrhachis-furcata BCC 54312]|uniref:Phosphoinositide phospholipase C n=1 Tax=Ophiocordyceps polyrhachis-furcata BCC 54312 TaxID=1330021 RepID=A0A367LJM3_9HYPO|nr:hypothetical protein L249_6419 [Ophiocordyceps polyrhachis-furcata BCC 54312]